MSAARPGSVAPSRKRTTDPSAWKHSRTSRPPVGAWPRNESDMIVRALRARSVPVGYMVADNEGHSLARKENLVHFLARSARFLEHHLGPPTAPRTASAR